MKLLALLSCTAAVVLLSSNDNQLRDGSGISTFLFKASNAQKQEFGHTSDNDIQVWQAGLKHAASSQADKRQGSDSSMADWNLDTRSPEPLAMRVPDELTSLSQLERLVAAAARPFVVVNERELSVLRRGLTKDGWKRSLYLQPAPEEHGTYVGAGLLSVANQWLDKPIEIPRRSGHLHHFFCDCGSRLGVPANLQPKPEYACPACGKRYSGEKYDGGVRYILHNRLAGAALSLALVYGIEKDRAYADKAAEILTKYAEAYPGPHTSHTEGGIMYQSLCEAVWVIPLAQAYDLIYYSRSLTDQEKRTIEDKLFRPVAEGLKHVGIGGNWGSWHLSAVGVVGLAVKDAPLVQYALDSLRSQLAEQLGSDGLWPESVHCYHFYPLSAFVHFAEACSRTGIDVYGWQVKPGRSLKAMFLAPLQHMYPSFRLPAINDGWYDAFLPLHLYEIACRRWPDPAFAWVLKKGYRFGESPINREQKDGPGRFRRNSFYAFLFGRDLPGRTAAPVLRSGDFQQLGICTLRNGDAAMVTFDYGPFLGHGHLDKLGFTFYAINSLLVPDYGTPGYGSKILGWYQGTASHNTVVVDGRSQAHTKDYSLKSRYSGQFVQFAEATTEECYPGVKQTRRVTLVGSACVVSDELASEAEHDYDWFVRCEGEPGPVSAGQPAELDAPQYAPLQIDHAYAGTEPVGLSWKCEQGSLALSLSTHGSKSITAVGRCPAETANRTASVVVCRQHAKRARFQAVLVPSPDGNAVEVTRHGCVVKLASKEETDLIYLRDGAGATAGMPVETDAEIAVVRLEPVPGNAEGGQRVRAIALVRGTYIRWHGEMLLECPSPVECVEVLFDGRSPVVRYCCDTPGTIKLKTKARAVRVNGHRTAATGSDGHMLLRIAPQMLDQDALVRGGTKD